ncbi:glycosyltransferase family 2 protein [Planktotalea arctica]|uniref:glycosyltransferase family 2 protein n=1 Tax=Planktotalea arctica TaxID=1481893 RepID=UPI000A171897|nr:glycosyltransferase family 2 protein [Planktotalea arctica]
MSEPKWGIVSTIKAPLHEVLGFAAYHLQRGAHRLYIYLDDPDPASFAALKAHPKVRPTRCDAAYWAKKGNRPAKHQPRQTINAADAYAKRVEVDWLTHIDHDEFLVWDAPFPEQLAALPETCLCARIRPVEAISWDGPETEPRPFKGFALPMPERRRITEALYPEFGAHLNGGFLSHVAGKMIYRTGIDGFTVKIHNAFLGDVQNPGQEELSHARLCHLHGDSWQAWRASYDYRKSKGAYRAELNAPFDHGKGGLSMHALLSSIEQHRSEAGLRAFYDEVCTPRPQLLQGLGDHGLLHWHMLDLRSAIEEHFPQHAP